MPMWIPIAIGAALIAFLATRSASASPPPAGGAGIGSLEGIRAAWGAALSVYPSPMPIGAMLRTIRAESGGDPNAAAYGAVTGASELGGTQLVVEHDENGTPKLGSGAGAIGADVDPLNRLGAVYGAQWVYAAAKRRFAADLEERGMRVPSDSEVRDWITLMHAHHSIGPGGLRTLLDGMKRRGTLDPIVGLWVYATAIVPPKLGRQSPDLVRKRIIKMLALPGLADSAEPLPASIEPLRVRVPEVPRFDAARAKARILEAKRRKG